MRAYRIIKGKYCLVWDHHLAPPLLLDTLKCANKMEPVKSFSSPRTSHGRLQQTDVCKTLNCKSIYWGPIATLQQWFNRLAHLKRDKRVPHAHKDVKSTDWQWKWQLQSCYSTFHNPTHSKHLMKRWFCLPCCCDVRCVYVGKLRLDRSCTSFRLGWPFLFRVGGRFFSVFRVQWIIHGQCTGRAQGWLIRPSYPC